MSFGCLMCLNLSLWSPWKASIILHFSTFFFFNFSICDSSECLKAAWRSQQQVKDSEMQRSVSNNSSVVCVIDSVSLFLCAGSGNKSGLQRQPLGVRQWGNTTHCSPTPRAQLDFTPVVSVGETNLHAGAASVLHCGRLWNMWKTQTVEGHSHQLLREDVEAFLGQMKNVISPAFSRSTLEFTPSWTWNRKGTGSVDLDPWTVSPYPEEQQPWYPPPFGSAYKFCP